MVEFPKIKHQMTKYGTVEGLMKYFTVNNLKEIHDRLDNKKALGLDKVSKDEYSLNLVENLNNLIDKMKRFEYYPKPVRRVTIPKGKGKFRKLGISSHEDKVVQGLMAEILHNIYEEVFLNCSYGFRPRRNCHLALKEINNIISSKNINYIVDMDIKNFFDSLNQEILISLLQKVIKDKHFIKYTRRFLKAGILDNKVLLASNEGTPQGGIISPILANVYLHYALDIWFERYIKLQTKGQCYLVRYADDFIMFFEYYEDSVYVYNEVVKRLESFDLQLQLDKTKVFKFSINEITNNTFDYLGLCIYNYQDINHNIKIGYRTSHKNIIRKYEDIKCCIYNNKDENLNTICNKLNDKLRGYYNYYGFNTNLPWLKDIYLYTLLELSNYLKGKHISSNPEEIVSKLPIIKPYICVHI